MFVRAGRSTRLTGYDAAYLQLAAYFQLADRLNVPLATDDEQMKAAAKLIGAPLVTQ